MRNARRRVAVKPRVLFQQFDLQGMEGYELKLRAVERCLSGWAPLADCPNPGVETPNGFTGVPTGIFARGLRQAASFSKHSASIG